ncbi:rhomboid-related protein 4 [Grus japonensis]|uniref:Rhomboid-related protein 4 n=1 Tax=Grus japonensis TaxID=30415 RepID=A0ABC9X743_GRUJA
MEASPTAIPGLKEGFHLYRLMPPTRGRWKRSEVYGNETNFPWKKREQRNAKHVVPLSRNSTSPCAVFSSVAPSFLSYKLAQNFQNLYGFEFDQKTRMLIGVVYMVLEFMLVKILDDPLYERNCAVGFSGVLFALKVLNNHYNPGRVSNILGFQIPSKYACWVELVAIHLISPGTSFAGHLAGILVGLMYTMGPLKKIMKACAGGISSFADPARPRDYNSEYYGYPGYPYRTPRSYYDYTGGLTEEEQLERAVLNSLNERDFGGATYNSERRPYGFWFPPEQHSEEERRRQRLRWFETR